MNLYKRKGCTISTIEECDYNMCLSDHENKDKIIIKNLTWHKDVDLINQLDVILEVRENLKDTGELKRYLGYFEDIKIDAFSTDFDRTWLYCNKAVFVICVCDYLKDVEIIKEKVYDSGMYE